jgi:hypothetical protein
MGRDEKIGHLLAGIGVLWMFGGLALAALVVQWLRAWGIDSPGVGRGLVIYHIVVLSIIAFGAMFFQLRSALRSEGLAGAFLLILQVLMSCLGGVALWRILDGWMRSWGFW